MPTAYGVSSAHGRPLFVVPRLEKVFELLFRLLELQALRGVLQAFNLALKVLSGHKIQIVPASGRASLEPQAHLAQTPPGHDLAALLLLGRRFFHDHSGPSLRGACWREATGQGGRATLKARSAAHIMQHTPSSMPTAHQTWLQALVVCMC